MTYWAQNRKHIKPVVDAFERAADQSKLIVIDGGAAGSISEPFNVIEECITAIRFEPRGETEVMGNSNSIYIDGGLWDSDLEMKLHVAKQPTASSICPPNNHFLKQFDDKYGVPARATTKEINVPMRSIDSCVSAGQIPRPNFIKLDIHSAELPALIGAKNSLEDCIGLLVETWNSEVHQGQGLHHQVEKFAIENGFELFDSICASRWCVKHNGNLDINDKGRYIGSEVLFIKTEIREDMVLSQALILCLFGFTNDAKNRLGNYLLQPDVKKFYDAVTAMQLLRRNDLKNRFKVFLRQLVNYFGARK
jgi:FkbM family methyltransferase